MNMIRVLIVDDRTLSRDALRISLIRYQCEFFEARTGVEALALMAANQFDVSFIDLRLPDMSGIDVLRAARERDYTIGLPAIVTGEPKPSTEDEASALGAKFLLKPMLLAQIRAAVQEAVPGAIAARVITPFNKAAGPEDPQ